MERINIFGLPGCLMPNNEGMCTSCCTHMNVQELEKPKHVPCGNISTLGCGTHGTPSQPMECVEFHCNQVSNNMKWWLIAQCEKDGTITPEQADKARELWLIS